MGQGVATTGSAPVTTTRLGGSAASQGARLASVSFHATPCLSQVPAPTQPEAGFSPGVPAGRTAARTTHRNVTETVLSRSLQRA